MQQAASRRHGGLGLSGGYAATLYTICAALSAVHVAGQLSGSVGPRSKKELNTCSCDCCTSVERPPAEIEYGNNGELIRYKCTEGSLQRNDRCHATCMVFSAHDEVDYSRFCWNDCMPQAASAGSTCFSRLDPLTDKEVDRGGIPTIDEVQPIDSRSSGLGTAAGPPSLEAQAEQGAAAPPPATPWQAKEQKQLEAQMEKANEAMGSAMDQRVVVWDYRNLVAERLRAEVGADIAHGAAAGERIRVNNAALDRNIGMAKKVTTAMEKVPPGLDEAVAKATADAQTAKDDATATKLALRVAKASLGPTLRGTRVLASNAVSAKVAALSPGEAKAYAHRAHWDKPDIWGRVLANRAAQPYMEAMTMASQRAAQYEAYAKRILHEAQLVQNQAAAMAPEIQEKKKEGDFTGSIREANRMTTLLERAHNMDAEAHYEWSMAESSWKSIPEWQAVAYSAAAATANAYQFKDEAPAGE